MNTNSTFGQRPNYINVPMYRKGIEQKMASGQRVYLVTCVDNAHTDRYIQYQVITPKPLKKIETELTKLQSKLFYEKYLYQAESMTVLPSEIEDIDEVNTSILFTVR